ncbi:unnamed protein product [Vicia faba]|uniref:Uncharacterized protein n=1 Tax=Vicia faba TaxID=3906 RepID=A0AAV1AT02_VICFA|nr:unnamed protein product [Vicia faba]
MDIEPLWSLGGWIFLSNCMAEPNTSKQLIFFHFLTVFLILLLIINLSHQPTSTLNPSSTSSTESTMSSSSTSTTFHPHKPQKHGAGKEFGVDAHEVPSGPNPISNR